MTRPGVILTPQDADADTPRRLAPDDLPGALDGVGVIDPFASMADPEHGRSSWVMVPRLAHEWTASADRVGRLIDDPSLRERIVVGAQSDIASHYSDWDASCERIFTIMREVAERPVG